MATRTIGEIRQAQLEALIKLRALKSNKSEIKSIDEQIRNLKLKLGQLKTKNITSTIVSDKVRPITRALYKNTRSNNYHALIN